MYTTTSSEKKMKFWPNRKWCFMDMVIDHATGKLSESKVWVNIGKAALTGILINEAYQGTLTEPLLMWFGFIVCLHELGARALSNKYVSNQGSTSEQK